ncbi:MAG: hypothetical protein KGM16_19035 [Bacteroidota bacterium]|nr:hypothetical protein [Bacteroidota bacterium]
MLKNAASKVLLFFMPLLFFTVHVKSQVTDSTYQDKKDTIVQNEDTIHLPPEDTIYLKPLDTLLRIKNFSPYFTLHVDSTLDYRFEINKNPYNYYWYLKNSPVGLRINKDNGLLHFKAEKSYFLSGKLKYDTQYKVKIGVQNLDDPQDHMDTTFSILFYNTDIIPSKIKPTVSSDLSIDEGDTLNFKLQCEQGSFPLESITYYCNYPIRSTTPITQCGDQFTWVAPYDFIKDNDEAKEKTLILKFIGVDKFYNRDTAEVTIKVNQAINYPRRLLEYNKLTSDIETYILQLKSTFRSLDEKIKKTKNTRTTFDLTSATTSLGGTVFSSMQNQSLQTTGKILPSVGVALVPVKEAVAPNKNDELNAASLVRNDIKRLQYLLTDNALVGDKDPDIVQKIAKMKDELQQIQLQLIDVTIVDNTTNKKELDEYFNNPKVNKKYRLKSK